MKKKLELSASNAILYLFHPEINANVIAFLWKEKKRAIFYKPDMC